MLTAEQKALMTLTTEWALTFYLVEKKRNPFRQLYEETSVSHEIQLTCYNVNHLLKRKLNIQYWLWDHFKSRNYKPATDRFLSD